VKVAAITMTYNEPDFLPIWVRHYVAQVGPKHCYVIDHGSDDGSTEALGEINVVRIPRSPQDEEKRARFISKFCSSLLEWYDYVVHTDVDEIVVADPALYKSLREYCITSTMDVVTAVGFNVVHTGEDLPIGPETNILKQRKWMYFLAPMFKPVLTRRPLEWTPGFHRARDVEPRFNDLYLFHLRLFDRDIGLRRLARTRNQPWVDPEACWWQRIPDEDCLRMFDAYANLKKNPDVKISNTSPELLDAISRTLGSAGGRLNEPDTFNDNFEVGELWQIPKRFGRVF